MTQSPVTREVEMARRAADSERTTILIQGERMRSNRSLS